MQLNELEQSKKNIIIWGIGRRTQRYMEFNYFEQCNIVCFCDKNNWGKTFYGYEVYEPNHIGKLIDDVDYILLSTQWFSEVYQECLNMGIEKSKIVFTDYVAEPFMMQNLDVIKSISVKLYKDVRMRIFRLMNENERDDYDETRLVGKGLFSSAEYIRDYFRYRTFEFAANEIIENKIGGEIAELGVFRGTFSALINEKFKDRLLYLFDTFEGFEVNEASREKEKGRSDEEFEYVHKATSEEILLSNLPYRENCRICKGFFPNTVTKEIASLNFAFVSIDVDFEDSIYEGIKFFYPRLSENGVIFLHDFNSQFLSGVKEAVRRFEKDNDIILKKVPLADRAGTLVIIK